MPTYRFILQGEGLTADGIWFGFYAGRQAWAVRSEEAETLVLEALVADWTRGDAALGRLTASRALCYWRAPLVSWRPLPNIGYSLFDDDLDAQAAAFRIETAAARTPLAIRAQFAP